MASNIKSNPVYYSLSSLSSGQNLSSRTVVLHKRPDHNGFGVYIGEDIPSGLYVVTVENNSPAADANIRPGDRVLAVNGQLVSSMPPNPKQIVVQAASNSQKLTLTIQSTDIFEKLNIPLVNNYSNNNNNNNSQQHSSQKAFNINGNLESYIKSLFANENVQILPSKNNEYILSSDPYAISSMKTNSMSSHRSDTRDYKHERTHHHHHHHDQQHHHHRHRHHAKPTLRETKQTQTSLDDDDHQDENIPQEESQNSPERQYLSYPNMGTSQRILRAQGPTSHDNIESISQESKPLKSDRNSKSNKSSSSTNPDDTYNNSTKNTHSIPKHVAEVVEAAVTTSRNQEQSNNNERIASDESPSNIKPTATPPLSRQSQNNLPRESTSISRQVATTNPSQQQPAPAPPPYTPRVTTAAATTTTTPSNLVNNRESVNEGSYNVRSAQENRQVAPPMSQVTSFIRGEGLRELQLHRAPNFDGFGFHLQYNKTYYLVHRIENNSPAEIAGLRVNDVIRSINQQTTENMPHSLFVQIVTSSSDVIFVVQSVDDYLRANPQPPRTKPIPSTSIKQDNEKHKSGISKALEKLTSR